MNPYYEREGITIYHGDCRDIMRNLDCRVDFVLTDPPYNIGKKYKGYNDKKPKDEFWSLIDQSFQLAYTLLVDKAHLTFTCAQKQVWDYKLLLEPMGLTFRHIGVWHNPGRKAGSFPGQWTYCWEPVMDFTKGGFKKLNNSNSVGHMDIWIERPPNDSKHPARRPMECWTYLVEMLSDGGDLVLDPFLGSGTTLIACAKMNRFGIGIDVSEEYCEESAKRIDSLLDGP